MLQPYGSIPHRVLDTHPFGGRPTGLIGGGPVYPLSFQRLRRIRAASMELCALRRQSSLQYDGGRLRSMRMKVYGLPHHSQMRVSSLGMVPSNKCQQLWANECASVIDQGAKGWRRNRQIYKFC